MSEKGYLLAKAERDVDPEYRQSVLSKLPGANKVEYRRGTFKVRSLDRLKQGLKYDAAGTGIGGATGAAAGGVALLASRGRLARKLGWSKKLVVGTSALGGASLGSTIGQGMGNAKSTNNALASGNIRVTTRDGKRLVRMGAFRNEYQ